MITFGKFCLQQYSDSLIVTDEHIAKLYGITGDNVFFVPRGERAKSFACVQALCNWFLQKNLPRNGRVVAVGGGSIGDVVGFCASIYKRGVHLTHVPTTLLAQIDSSIGGKTAIDLDGVKNAVGTFYSADTLVDVDFLSTLDGVQLQNGYGELLKYRMLCQDIDQARENLPQAIKACINYKQQLCADDPFDHGIRQKLNFGHTIGHAMELTLDIPHGLAVLNGIYYETQLAHALGLVDKQYLDKWQAEVTQLCNPCPMVNGLLQATVNDKKNTNGMVAFALPPHFETIHLPLERVKKLLLDD